MGNLETPCTVARGLLGVLPENFPEHADDFLESARALRPARWSREAAHSSRQDSVIPGRIRVEGATFTSSYGSVTGSEMARRLVSPSRVTFYCDTVHLYKSCAITLHTKT